MVNVLADPDPTNSCKHYVIQSQITTNLLLLNILLKDSSSTQEK